jgi:hypothetical protein
MARYPILYRIAWAHTALIVGVAISLHVIGLPVKGTLLGGGFIGFSFVALWIFTRAIVEPQRKRLAIAVGILKFLLYAVLGAAVLSGRFVADAGGFALGVTVFIVITLAVALTTPIARNAEP